MRGSLRCKRRNLAFRRTHPTTETMATTKISEARAATVIGQRSQQPPWLVSNRRPSHSDRRLVATKVAGWHLMVDASVYLLV